MGFFKAGKMSLEGGIKGHITTSLNTFVPSLIVQN